MKKPSAPAKCLLGIILLLLVGSVSCADENENIWVMLRALTSGAPASVSKSIQELQENPEYKFQFEQLLTYHLSEAGLDTAKALEFVLQPQVQTSRSQRRKASTRDSLSNGLLRYQKDMIEPVFGNMANNTLPSTSDACDDRPSSSWHSEMTTARQLTLGLQIAATVARCVCRVGPKCIVIIPELIEIPLPFWCIPYIPLIVAADRVDYRYQHARFCMDVKLERLNDKINQHTQAINGILGELSRYTLEEQLFYRVTNPSVVETSDRGGRIEYALQLVKDVLYRRDLTLLIPGSSYSQTVLNASETALNTVITNTSLSEDDRNDLLAQAFTGMADAYWQSLLVTDDESIFGED